MLCYTKTLKHTHARQIFSSRRWNVCCAEAKPIDKAFGETLKKNKSEKRGKSHAQNYVKLSGRCGVNG